MTGARPPALALVGVGAGVVSGLLGVGGGIVMVPLLVTISRLSQHEAHATSLAAIVPIAAIGAATFALEGRVSYVVAALLIPGTIAGAAVGARAMARSSEGPLQVAFGALSIALGIFLVVS